MTGADRREQILDVTRDLAASRGFHALSIEAVAREAGVTRPVIYGHFSDLEGLLAAVLARESARAEEQLEAVLPRLDAAVAPAEVFLRGFAAYLTVVEENPATWRLLLMPAEGTPAVLRERVAEGRALAVSRIEAVLRATGLLGEDIPDAELTAAMLSALSDEAARLLLTDPATFGQERLLAHARWLLGRLGA